jgi:hypothetical protein
MLDGWLDGWLAAVADSQSWKDHILLSCVLADLIWDDTRFRVVFSPSPPPLSLSLSFQLSHGCQSS